MEGGQYLLTDYVRGEQFSLACRLCPGGQSLLRQRLTCIGIVGTLISLLVPSCIVAHLYHICT